MSEYIFQGETMTNLADAFRYKLKDAESLSVEDMRKLVYLMHYDLDNGVTLYDYNNEPVYSYSIAEANSLVELPTDGVYLPAGYMLSGWSHTLHDINATTEPLVVTAVYEDIATRLVFGVPTANTDISFYVFAESDGNVSIDWGDGSVENYEIGNETGKQFAHTCDGAGEYTVRIIHDCVVSLTINDTNLKTMCATTNISGFKFSGCTGLTSVTIPDSVTTIGYQAFAGCTSLTSVTIPDSVTSIDMWAFNNCDGLTSITIPDSVTSIGNSAFYGCNNLSSVTIGSGVTSIIVAAFAYCTNLTSITIPDGVTSIGDQVFYGCSGLTSVTIGSGVASIGYQAFYNCTSLASAVFKDTSGWYRTTTQGATSGTTISNLTNTSTAATYLKTTYSKYYWYDKT